MDLSSSGKMADLAVKNLLFNNTFLFGWETCEIFIDNPFILFFLNFKILNISTTPV